MERRLEAQASNIKVYQTEVARLEEQVEELLGLAGMDKERITKLEAWMDKWYPTLAGRAIALKDSGETVAAEIWGLLCRELYNIRNRII